MPDLESIISFYELGGEERPSKSPLLKRFKLDDRERQDLLSFLEDRDGASEPF
jgi:cytochrome c peroxidase